MVGHLSEIVPKCSETLLEACITTTASTKNTKLICSICRSNLSNGKLLVCSKKKMEFSVKPQCLKLTPLEEK